jgi:hypothetical protein
LKQNQAEAWFAVWIPGTEGGGIADMLFRDYPFIGKLSYFWPRSNKYLPSISIIQQTKLAVSRLFVWL